jgi:hypothetical protein
VHGRERRATAMTVQYMDHLAPVQEPEVLVVPMSTPDLVSGLQWCNTLKPEIHWATSRLTALRTPSGQGEARRSGLIVQRYKRRDNECAQVRQPDIDRSTLTINWTSEIPVDPDGKPRERAMTVLFQILKYSDQPHSTIS